MNRFPRCLLVAAVIGWPAQECLAWNKAGHMASGAFAYQVLKAQSPATIEKVLDLLKKHPYYESHWLRRLSSIAQEDRDQFLFMMAARWPDDARNDEEYHHREWHYINFPYKPDGQPEQVKVLPPSANNIIRAFNRNLETVKNKTEDPGSRSVALAWIFHLVGDVHQPLHTSSLFTTEFPKGDQGGTAFFIRVRENSSVIHLHQFWDDLILGSDRVRSVKNRATELRLRKDLAPDQLAAVDEASFEKWAMESFQLAKTVVYREGQLAGSVDQNKAPVLPNDYVAQAKEVAERRIVMAGYRLAEVLKKSL